MRNIATFLLLFAVWMLWSGHTEPLLVGLGLASCLLVVLISARMGVLDEDAFAYDLVLRLFAYIPWVMWQVVKTNFDLAKLILSPSLPIQPKLVRIRVSQRTALGQAIHANTITLTPGTVTLDARGGTFLVHALTPDAISPEGAAELDARVTRLEGTPRHHVPSSISPQRLTESEEELTNSQRPSNPTDNGNDE